jgi:hypothetical protein
LCMIIVIEQSGMLIGVIIFFDHAQWFGLRSATIFSLVFKKLKWYIQSINNPLVPGKRHITGRFL